MIQVKARPFFKTSGFDCAVILTLQACISGILWKIFKCKVCESRLKIGKFSCLLREL